MCGSGARIVTARITTAPVIAPIAWAVVVVGAVLPAIAALRVASTVLRQARTTTSASASLFRLQSSHVCNYS